MEKCRVLDALSALANETRLELIRLLVGGGETGLTQGDIARRLQMSASRLAFHLAALEHAGLVASRRASRHVYYRADAANLGGVIGYLLNDCCDAHPEVRACCVGQAASARPDQFSGTEKT